MTQPITYFARLVCNNCGESDELPARAIISGGCSYLSAERCTAELDCDAYENDWHDCGEFVLCGRCWRGAVSDHEESP